jgi:hypothetical protein
MFSASKADNLTATSEPTVYHVGSLTSHNSVGLHGLLGVGFTLLLLTFIITATIII